MKKKKSAPGHKGSLMQALEKSSKDQMADKGMREGSAADMKADKRMMPPKRR